MFANEKSSSPLFSSIISDLWCQQSKKKPQRIKSTENTALDHGSILQFLTVKFTARTQSVFVASPHHFLSSSPDTLGMLGHVGDKLTPCRALQRCSGGTRSRLEG